MGKRIIIDDRIYEILRIDSNSKEVVVQKTGSALGNIETATLRAL